MAFLLPSIYSKVILSRFIRECLVGISPSMENIISSYMTIHSHTSRYLATLSNDCGQLFLKANKFSHRVCWVVSFSKRFKSDTSCFSHELKEL